MARRCLRWRPEKEYRYRICNVSIKTSLNFRFQGHAMELVEMDGSHTIQNFYDSLDIHFGHFFSVLVTADQTPGDYYIVASSRFLKRKVLTATAVVHYAGSLAAPSSVLPKAPTNWAWSFNQWRSFRWNLTARAARPNPQGSYHHGSINITRTIRFSSSRNFVDDRLRYALNGVSHVDTETPLKLAEYFGFGGNYFMYDTVGDEPLTASAPIKLLPCVKTIEYQTFVEIIFENSEKAVQAYHLDGYSFLVGMGTGKWSPEKRKTYNMLDVVSGHAVHVFPKSWSAFLMTFDNVGIWNLRSELWERRYLGQQLYISVQTPVRSLRDEYSLPDAALLCGAIVSPPKPPPYT
ncbi:hypothetical protein ZIOFF_009664 [Zingiber officinale]|uniref:Uncharacterized protein n=1 Tax=Zingiber officinale TaxID=94328 RepID=A0A8J5LRM0_ZINOF|nr:hypothetical protein ZIOFF_009664 [Zingiber officinale]